MSLHFPQQELCRKSSQDASCARLPQRCTCKFSSQHRATVLIAPQRAQSLVTPTPIDLAADPVFIARPPLLPIRNHLGKWQAQYGGPSEETLSAFEKHPLAGEAFNNVSKISSASAADVQTQGDRWVAGEDDDGEDLVTIGLFLKPGDVVELS